MVYPDSRKVSRAPRYLGIRPRKSFIFRLRGSHPLWRAFPDPSSRQNFCNFPAGPQPRQTRSHDTGWATPAGLTPIRFRLFPFRSPLLGESLRFLFLGVLRCFSSPGSLRPLRGGNVCFHRSVLRFGNRRVKACWRLAVAYRNQLRPSSSLGAKASPGRS